jgi:hypothetical protein
VSTAKAEIHKNFKIPFHGTLEAPKNIVPIPYPNKLQILIHAAQFMFLLLDGNHPYALRICYCYND